MLAIELPILHYKDESKNLVDLEIDIPIHDCEERLMTFYIINAVRPYYEDNIEYTSILTGSEFFLCKFPYSHVKFLLENNN